ncbi:MAG: alkyl sulfatase dimerization domain-containing protein [Pseudomonadota bacterium]
MTRIALLLSVLLILSGCDAGGDGAGNESGNGSAPTVEALHQHSEEFREEVIEVTEGVHVAVGFGIANSIMIEGDDGLIIIDTMESMEAAERIHERFRAISDKPIKAVVYTHSHPDHIFGTGAFVDPGEDVAVFAHDTLMAQADQIFSVLRPIITNRAMHMFGNRLDDADRTNVGIGAFVDTDEDTTVQMIRPTRTFSDRLEVEVAGVRMVMEHAPGETDDQILVWLPDKEVLLPGDNIYKAFPNLYTIRGTSYRDPQQWVESLDRMRELEPEYLVPSHGRPLTDTDHIQSTLTDYRDGIQYVYDQTLRMMNSGLTPDEIAARMELPPHLAASPYLQPFYGKPEWGARAIYSGLIGWFDSNTTHLHPTPPDEKAQRIADLAGGVDALEDEVREASQAGEHQWVLELTDHLLRVDTGNTVGREARREALETLAAQESNPNARHYYLTEAGKLAGNVTIPKRLLDPTDEMLESIPLEQFFRGLSAALDAEAAEDVHKRVTFEFPDLDQTYTLIVRRGVAEFLEGEHEEADIHVRVQSLPFKRMLAEQSGAIQSIAFDFEYVRGGRLGLGSFLNLFDPEVDAGAGG